MKVVLTTTDFETLKRKFPDWENEPYGQPRYMVRMSSTEWMLWPSPSTRWYGLPMTVKGCVLPPATTDVNTSPPVSVALHSCYSHYIAWKCFLLLNNAEKAAQEYTIFDSLRRMNTKAGTQTQGALQSIRF